MATEAQLSAGNCGIGQDVGAIGYMCTTGEAVKCLRVKKFMTKSGTL